MTCDLCGAEPARYRLTATGYARNVGDNCYEQARRDAPKYHSAALIEAGDDGQLDLFDIDTTAKPERTNHAP